MILREVAYSKSFSKSLKRLLRSGRFDNSKLELIIEILASNKEMSSGFKDHALKADWHGYRECHIESDLLLIYKIEDTKLTLSYLSSHSELFG